MTSSDGNSNNIIQSDNINNEIININQHQLSTKITKIFDDIEDELHMKLNKLKYVMYINIHGYMGLEKEYRIDSTKKRDRLIINVNEMFDKFEKELSGQMEKLKDYRNEVLLDINKKP